MSVDLNKYIIFMKEFIYFIFYIIDFVVRMKFLVFYLKKKDKCNDILLNNELCF